MLVWGDQEAWRVVLCCVVLRRTLHCLMLSFGDVEIGSGFKRRAELAGTVFTRHHQMNSDSL